MGFDDADRQGDEGPHRPDRRIQAATQDAHHRIVCCCCCCCLLLLLLLAAAAAAAAAACCLLPSGGVDAAVKEGWGNKYEIVILSWDSYSLIYCFPFDFL